MFGSADVEKNFINMQQGISGSSSGQNIAPAQNQEYGDFILRNWETIPEADMKRMNAVFQKVNEMSGILYIPLEQAGVLEISSYTYSSIPKCYSPMDINAMDAGGISQSYHQPYLKLQGEGVAIAVIDSGIDYTHPVFREGDRSRIAYLWDQTIIGSGNETVPYGRVFVREEIEQAIKSENPYETVPSRDENGHGTALAGLAAGNVVPSENFSGAAPRATLIIVKLKKAKTYLKEFYQIPPLAEVYQEDDIMLGVSYAVRMAKKMGMPVSVCLGLGSSQGAHIGDSELSRYLDYINEDANVSVSVAAGNEGIAQHHFTAELSEEQETVELKIGEQEGGFYTEFWGNPPDDYRISVQSPAGEILDISTSIGSVTQKLSFIFTATQVLVNYVKMERSTGKQLIYFRFLHPASGIWKIHVQKEKGPGNRFHMWLPVQGLISQDTYFLQSNPYSTVTAPGDSVRSITATAYQYRDASLFFQAGRGFTPDGQVTPDLAAPGVELIVPLNRQQNFGKATGSSLSAAITCGAAALLLEWAIVRGNLPYASGSAVKFALQKGAVREERMNYPNPEWGFGRLSVIDSIPE